ncbi:FERM, ARHGEF and pleckstrin domain-containing protein 2-like [Rhopilema esculentum]|uniref:FERM, ARHGEF and pleckstrin domain-containing protein 2-like n=1 Tax=Rhopilema esculentum TaxID=499914 RepID=UPI0031E42FFC|eukprot:gene16484-7901_t
MAEEVSSIGNEKATKPGKGRIQVSLLDDTVLAFDVESKAKGEQLYQKVNGHLKVEESDYFGLQYYDSEGNLCWLDPQKAINKQVKEPSKVTFKFRVMFYTPDPNALQEYTRYLFTLQIRRDLLDGRLHCSADTGSLLASYIVQGELGDFEPTVHQDGYLSGFQFVPNQSPDIEDKIIEYHMTHRGKSPAEADRNMLDVARNLEMYGITLYPAKDRDDVDLSLSVFHMGILVFQNQSRINMFSWAKIRKLSFKKKKFVIKLHPGVYTADVVVFLMQSRDACKGFWKICIAHHVFFRQKKATQKHRKSSVLSRGSKYRYSGRTQKQLVEESRDTFRPTAELERNRTSRIHRGSEAQTPIGSVNSNELTILPTTSPQSYTSFKLDNSPPKHNQSSSSFKNSTDASEDEGSFVVGSRKSSQQWDNSHDAVETLAGAVHLEYDAIRIPQQDTKEDEQEVLAQNSDKAEIDAEEPKDERRIRSDSDTEIGRQVQSIYSQIEKETSWQYHLTPTDIDDGEIVDTHLENDINELVNGEIDQVDGDTNHIDLDLGFGGKHQMTNGDLNANEVEGITLETEDVLLQSKMKDSLVQVISTSNGTDSKESGQAILSQHNGDMESDPVSKNEDSFSVERKENGNVELDMKIPDTLFHMVNEILLTERTYVKDLEVLTVSFKEEMTANGLMPDSLMDLFFGNIDPLYDFHCSFLAELEDKVSVWEADPSDSNNVMNIGEVLHSNMKNLKLLVTHVKNLDEVLLNFHKEIIKSPKLSVACKEFELDKVCYLPLNTFLLKPTQRLQYYKGIFPRLYKECQNGDEVNYSLTKAAYLEVSDILDLVSDHVTMLENLHKLIELDRDLIDVENIVHPSREFIREGCLYKISRKDPQPRMFFLFSDTLLYTTKGLTQKNQFRIRAHIPLHSIKIEEGGFSMHGLFTFTVHSSSGKPVHLAATSHEERLKWLEDLATAVNKIKSKALCSTCNAKQNGDSEANDDSSSPFTCYSCKDQLSAANYPTTITINSRSKDGESEDEEISTAEDVSTLERNHSRARTLSTRRVCWHRHTSIGMNEYKTSIQNNLSGELFTRFESQSKWQRLWVVFTNFSLFFFRSCEDDEPVASLPLIGYTVSRPSKDDGIDDAFAFKLQFKVHVYFFRAENPYAFIRWFEVLECATNTATR